MGPPWTSEEKDLLRSRKQERQTDKEIGIELNRTSNAVGRMASLLGFTNPRREPDIREKALKLYASGKSGRDVGQEMGIPFSTILKWIRDAGISRPVGASGYRNGMWTGENASYKAQHYRASTDFPKPLGMCEVCGIRKARCRMRIDHTLLQYRKELVVLGCYKCNKAHDRGDVSFTFQNDEKLCCATKIASLVEL